MVRISFSSSDIQHHDESQWDLCSASFFFVLPTYKRRAHKIYSRKWNENKNEAQKKQGKQHFVIPMDTFDSIVSRCVWWKK